MSLKQFIKDFTVRAKSLIEKYEKYKDYTGEQKKERVDYYITQYTNQLLNNLPLNFLLKLAIKKFFIPNIPYITQAIFDLIKSKVEGITK